MYPCDFYIYIYHKVYHKELAHVIMEAGSFQICRVSQQVGDPGQPVTLFQSVSKSLSIRGGDVYGYSINITFNHQSNQKYWESLLLPYCTDEKTEI